MNTTDLIEHFAKQGRILEAATAGDDALGPLKDLPGTWANLPGLPGRGWNMIALPFEGSPLRYRLLLNQYNETLKFSTVDKGVPNRGLPGPGEPDADQLLAVLDYEQTIEQIAAADSPESGLAGEPGLPIHHEPGLWIHILNRRTNDLDVARLATIPHGNSALALGRSFESEGQPAIPAANGLPIGVDQDLSTGYLAPYKHFDDDLFRGLFTPVHPNLLLAEANSGVEIVRTTKLEVDTKLESGGIVNLPFIEREADATEMTATFWIQELAEAGPDGRPKLRLQYTQTVFLDFFPRRDGQPGRIRWPHISINTLEKVD